MRNVETVDSRQRDSYRIATTAAMVPMTLCPFTEPIDYVKFIKFVSDAINKVITKCKTNPREAKTEKKFDDFVHLPTSIEHLYIFSFC